ncbi:ubiquitin-like small modifier protein 1 [Haloprofundus halophilus]|uniref:ubiquitin-like small modifier protein 1 n=1 Tax=Haloprofundus halophilus TaxID=2283527 RepID=UPI000E442EBF|nr:ubiquitin-like small modifier protein 1 [Haloprofundus halophilus]
MQWKLFADLAETAGTRTVSLNADCDTVGDALDVLLSSRPALESRVLDDGEVRDHINVLRNGENVFTGEGLDTPVADGDELALFPPVSGG